MFGLFKKKPEEAKKTEIYTTIRELPAWNYYKARSDNRWLYIGSTERNLESFPKSVELQKAFVDLTVEYLNHFGVVGEKAQLINTLKVEMLDLKVKVLLDDASAKIRLKLKEKELERLTGEENEEFEKHFWEQKAHLEKYKGFRIDPKTTSTLEYFTDINLLIEQGEKIERDKAIREINRKGG